MYNNAAVHSNSITTYYGDGGEVYANGGIFTMYGNAAIRNNTSSSKGGGVWVGSNGSFTMWDNASVYSNNTTNASYGGGGVYVSSTGSFTMRNSAAVYFNEAGYGGGVRVQGGTFTMMDNNVSDMAIPVSTAAAAFT